jgi:hypothetical protein
MQIKIKFRWRIVEMLILKQSEKEKHFFEDVNSMY